MIKSKVLVIGAGTLSRLHVSMLDQHEKYEAAGFAEDEVKYGYSGRPLPVLGSTSELRMIMDKHHIQFAVVAVGDNKTRERLFMMASGAGYEILNLVHPSAIVAKEVYLNGFGITIMPGAIVNPGTMILSGALINTKASIDHDCLIHEFVHLAPGASLAGCVIVGMRTLIGLNAAVNSRVEIGSDCIVVSGGNVFKNMANGERLKHTPLRRL